VEQDFLVAFSTVPGIGPVRLRLLLEFFGSAQKAWTSLESELQKTGLPMGVLGELLLQKKKLIPQQYSENIRKRGIKIVTIFDKDYPDKLKNIPDPPNVLFIKSRLGTSAIAELSQNKIIAVVGTRKVTSYGREVTAKLTRELVLTGFTIVSGMALGVDGIAHQEAINAGGNTFAVLGAGVEIVYPKEHAGLYRSIVEHDGVILSEVAPDKMVGRGIFPARNRIVSGLSEAVLVTEGAIDSGSLITARVALEQGREVFAVPGPINSVLAEGTNYLLKQGAKLVTKTEDILDGLSGCC
jgi:DNA processing protein